MNVNEEVGFVLTETGARIYNAHLPADAPRKKAGDACTEQLWKVMSIFGPCIDHGMPETPFQGNEIYFTLTATKDQVRRVWGLCVEGVEAVEIRTGPGGLYARRKT